MMNRLAFAFCLLFSIGARLIFKTRAKLEQRNQALEQKIAEDARERSQHSREMEHAWEIQQALFPKHFPRFAECCIAGGCQPARTVGGDYFDVIRLGEHRVAVTIADVVGKGMAAALLMSNLQAIVRAFVPSGLSPEELCLKANEVISGNIASGKFVSFFCAYVDIERMTIDYCNAGHNPPFLISADGEVQRLTEGGPLLGIFPNSRYEKGTAILKREDILVLFTDGITEAENLDFEQFGEERLLEAVKRAEAESPSETDRAKAIQQSIESSVYEFSRNSLQDDATLVVLTATSMRVSAARA